MKIRMRVLRADFSQKHLNILMKNKNEFLYPVSFFVHPYYWIFYHMFFFDIKLTIKIFICWHSNLINEYWRKSIFFRCFSAPWNRELKSFLQYNLKLWTKNLSLFEVYGINRKFYLKILSFGFLRIASLSLWFLKNRLEIWVPQTAFFLAIYGNCFHHLSVLKIGLKKKNFDNIFDKNRVGIFLDLPLWDPFSIFILSNLFLNILTFDFTIHTKFWNLGDSWTKIQIFKGIFRDLYKRKHKSNFLISP